MSINDGFGDDVEATLLSYDRWLHYTANQMAPPTSTQHDDLVQEGRIAMWRALDAYDASRGALPSWLTTAARLRMRDLAWGKGQPTGREATRGSKAAEETPLEDIVAAYGGDIDTVPFLRIDAMADVELAYHEGEIARALDTLSPSQRQYVFLRFWGGLDPSSSVPGTREIIKDFPVMRRRWLWSGTSKQVGAKQRLAEALEHLVGAA